MLVLSRGVDEGIMIGDDIRVTIVRINGGAIRIGIEAPKEAAIVRGEHLVSQAALDDQAKKKPSSGK